MYYIIIYYLYYLYYLYYIILYYITACVNTRARGIDNGGGPIANLMLSYYIIYYIILFYYIILLYIIYYYTILLYYYILYIIIPFYYIIIYYLYYLYYIILYYITACVSTRGIDNGGRPVANLTAKQIIYTRVPISYLRENHPVYRRLPRKITFTNSPNEHPLFSVGSGERAATHDDFTSSSSPAPRLTSLTRLLAKSVSRFLRNARVS